MSSVLSSLRAGLVVCWPIARLRLAMVGYPRMDRHTTQATSKPAVTSPGLRSGSMSPKWQAQDLLTRKCFHGHFQLSQLCRKPRAPMPHLFANVCLPGSLLQVADRVAVPWGELTSWRANEVVAKCMEALARTNSQRTGHGTGRIGGRDPARRLSRTPGSRDQTDQQMTLRQPPATLTRQAGQYTRNCYLHLHSPVDADTCGCRWEATSTLWL
jgi:hypothetical protein